MDFRELFDSFVEFDLTVGRETPRILLPKMTILISP